MEHQDEALKTYIGILRIASQLENLARRDVNRYNLNITEFSVLELLFHKGEQTTQTIKKKILIASSSTTYVIDQLVKKKYVCRTISQKDRRITMVSITDEGRRLLENIFPKHAKRINDCFGALTTTELIMLQTMLKKINNEEEG